MAKKEKKEKKENRKLPRFQAQLSGGGVDVIDIETGEYFIFQFDQFLEFASERKGFYYFHDLALESGAITAMLFARKFAYKGETGNRFEKVETDEGVCMSMKIRIGDSHFFLYNSRKKINSSYEQLRAVDKNCANMGDLEVIAYYMHNWFEEGLTAHTAAADALAKYKEMTFKDNDDFLQTFPKLALGRDRFIRQAYQGGWCYVNPKYQEKNLRGKAYDINSPYSYQMKDELMPYGIPILRHGEPSENPNFPLSISQVRFNYLALKEGEVPFAINKCGIRTETQITYVKYESNVVVYMTNVELELLKETYNFGTMTYIKSLSFKAKKGMFDLFVDYFYEKKEKAENGVERLKAKTMLNGLSGKFGSKIERRQYSYDQDEDGVEYRIFENRDTKKQRMVYTAVSVFINSYTRVQTIRAVNANADNFIYSDTDSIHVRDRLFKKVQGIEVHQTKMGAWKLEREFSQSKFIAQKCYAEFDKHEKKWHFVVSGIDGENIKGIENFYVGSVIEYKARTRTKQGFKLEKAYFRIGSKMEKAEGK